MKVAEGLGFGGPALLLVLVFLFPPFMCIDPESHGRVHAALGHHAAWNPPAAELVFRTLYPAAELPKPERLSDFVPRINTVQLAAETLGIALSGSLLMWSLGRQRRRSRHQQERG